MWIFLVFFFSSENQNHISYRLNATCISEVDRWTGPGTLWDTGGSTRKSPGKLRVFSRSISHWMLSQGSRYVLRIRDFPYNPMTWGWCCLCLLLLLQTFRCGHVFRENLSETSFLFWQDMRIFSTDDWLKLKRQWGPFFSQGHLTSSYRSFFFSIKTHGFSRWKTAMLGVPSFHWCDIHGFPCSLRDLWGWRRWWFGFASECSSNSSEWTRRSATLSRKFHVSKAQTYWRDIYRNGICGFDFPHLGIYLQLDEVQAHSSRSHGGGEQPGVSGFRSGKLGRSMVVDHHECHDWSGVWFSLWYGCLARWFTWQLEYLNDWCHRHWCNDIYWQFGRLSWWHDLRQIWAEGSSLFGLLWSMHRILLDWFCIGESGGIGKWLGGIFFWASCLFVP